MALKTDCRLTLFCSDHELELGFDRLKGEALHWVFEGYPVGDYYEAALPGRDAFCMRDTSHQCTGAAALGLSRHNYNMLRKFAQCISESRDFCSYWEIDRWNRPCPVDYASDADFWYNLPANFDVIDAIYRMYRWTGDVRYVSDPDFQRFVALSMEQYIARWDRDGDGIPDRILSEGRRGIASYDESNESVKGLRAGADLVCCMIRAYDSAAQLNRLAGHSEMARLYTQRGQALLAQFNEHWHDGEKGLAYGMGFDGQMVFPPRDPWREKDMLYWGIATPEQAEPVLQGLCERMDDTFIERFCHLPEILWRYGKQSEALCAMRRAMDPALPRRDYPEASYSAIGAVVTGFMGIQPDGEHNAVRTLPGLADVAQATLMHAHVLDGMVSVTHTGHTATTLTNECDHEITWQTCFPGGSSITVGGTPQPVQTCAMPLTGQKVAFASITLPAGTTATAQTFPCGK